MPSRTEIGWRICRDHASRDTINSHRAHAGQGGISTVAILVSLYEDTRVRLGQYERYGSRIPARDQPSEIADEPSSSRLSSRGLCGLFVSATLELARSKSLSSENADWAGDGVDGALTPQLSLRMWRLAEPLAIKIGRVA